MFQIPQDPTRQLLGCSSALSTSSCVNTRVYSPFDNLSSENPRRKLMHCTWRMSQPDVPCHRAPQISPWTSTSAFSSRTADFTCQGSAGWQPKTGQLCLNKRTQMRANSVNQKTLDLNCFLHSPTPPINEGSLKQADKEAMARSGKNMSLMKMGSPTWIVRQFCTISLLPKEYWNQRSGLNPLPSEKYSCCQTLILTFTLLRQC